MTNSVCLGILSSIYFRICLLFTRESTSEEPEVPKAQEPEVVPQIIEPNVQVEENDKKLNETEVEAELAAAGRHDQEEISIKVDLNSKITKLELELEEDPGQADDDDKDLYPNNRR